MDQIIEGKAFVNNSLHECCIGISNGKIIEVKKTLTGAPRKKFPKKIIFPSGIDIHVHFRDPGFIDKEDFHSGSIAAAYGGISCICDMPNTRPFTSTINALKKKDMVAKRKSIVDYGLYAGIDKENISEINSLSEHCCGYKLFLGNSTESNIVPAEKLPTIFKQLNNINKLLAVHAEDEKCLSDHNRRELSLYDHLLSRPKECEIKAIKLLIQLHTETNIQLHICHISSAAAIQQLEKRASSISIGATPHHLFFDIHKKISNPSFMKVNPPIRDSPDREYLWNSFASGKIDVVESDHAPHTLAEKCVDFDKSPSGMPGVETMFPILLAASKQAKLSLATIINCVCRRPAELINAPKGCIASGYDADLCVVDLKNVQKVSTEDLHSKCNWTPFEGFKAIFPSDVLIRGDPVIRDYESIGKAGNSKNIGKIGA